MADIVTVSDLVKRYDSGFEALKGVSLSIREGEILALARPQRRRQDDADLHHLRNHAADVGADHGRPATTPSPITAASRSLIGLVPQELTLEPFETVWKSVSYSRGLFGKAANDAHLESVLKQLSLWDKKDTIIQSLSGGMKRRVLIAKALSHEPRILFLDEPTAGVDVELRKGMWETVRRLKEDGVTIILTTHYIEEAEEISDRVGVIAKGEILLVEETADLMARMGSKELRIDLTQRIDSVPDSLAEFDLELTGDGHALVYCYDRTAQSTGITRLLGALKAAGIGLADLSTHQSSLEEIFVGLVHDNRSRDRSMNFAAIQAIYRREMARFLRTILQSFVSPVISTSLYFVVFGAAIGSRIDQVEGVSYGAFIVPGLDHAVGDDAGDDERLVGHLLSQVHRHDLRVALGPGELLRGGDRLRRRGRDQGAVHRRGDPRHVVLLRRHHDPAPDRDGRVPAADLPQLCACLASSSASGRRISNSCS